MRAGYDSRGGMTAEDRARVAAEFGMDSIPTPRYEDLPECEAGAYATEKFNFAKAMKCVNPIASAYFMGNFFPSSIPVDQSLDPHTFKRGWSQSAILNTKAKIPVNRKITAATGIGNGLGANKEADWYGTLALQLKWIYTESGARACSPVLVFNAMHLIGIAYKLDRTPAYGKTELDMVSNVGILHPQTHESKNKRLAVAGRAEIKGIDAPAAEDSTPGL